MRPMCLRPLAITGVVAAHALLCAPSGRAQPASPSDAAEASQVSDPVARARVRYDAGTRAFGQGRFVEAALEFEAAAAEKPNAIALSTAALSWERANVLDRAADDYARTVATPGVAVEQATVARQRLASLEGVLGTLSLTAPDGWRVELDANTEVATTATLHGTAGMHTLIVRPRDGTSQRIPVTLRSGTRTTIALPTAVASPLATAPPPSRGMELRRGTGLVVLGAAGTALLASSLLGIEALEARDAYQAAPSQATFDHASHLQTWTNVGFVAGGCLLVAGLGLALWPAPRAPSSSGTSRDPVLFVAVAPPGLLVQGRFAR
jgi:VCBS repeat-containing protein